MDLKTPDTKIVKRIVKKKIDMLDERQYKERSTVLTGRQIMHQMFSFFDMNKTQGRAMNIADLLNIELHAQRQAV